MKIHLSNLHNAVSSFYHGSTMPFKSYLRVDIIANLQISSQAVLPAEFTITVDKLHHLPREEELQRAIVLSDYIIVDCIQHDTILHQLR
jgi:hypothetical protein